MKNFITILCPLSTFFKERVIEKYIEPEEPEPEPQPEEIPVKGIQLTRLKSSSSYSYSSSVSGLCCCSYVVVGLFATACKILF